MNQVGQMPATVGTYTVSQKGLVGIPHPPHVIKQLMWAQDEDMSESIKCQQALPTTYRAYEMGEVK